MSLALTAARKPDPRKYRSLFLMMVPGLAYLLVNNYAPMLGLAIAFKDIDFAKGFFGSPWVGFKNFVYLFATSDAMAITRNTILYNIAFIAINTIVALFTAILLNEVRSKSALKAYQSAILIPNLISMVIVSYLVLAFLSSDCGFMNKTVQPLLGKESVSWYNEPKYWPPILVFINAWKNVGFLTVIFYAGIIGIDAEMYEAARMDGASKTRQIMHITIPQIVPLVIMMVLLFVGKIFYADFGLFYQVPLDSGSLYDATNVIDTYVYRALMQIGDIGMSSAAGFYQSLVGFVTVLASNLVVRKISPENALF
jgi:ABC-type polysaccharide transport system, permease component